MRKVGSNQYRVKRKKDIGAHLIGFLYLMILMVALYDISLQPFHVDAQDTKVVKAPPVAAPAESQQVVANLEATPAEIHLQSVDIEKYIKTIFGSDAKVAIAISHHECNPLNPKYPKCQLHTAHENSIGLFQINIESETTKVHWSRIPGDTLEEKITWLENPYNNTLLAYWIYKTSGWNPWSAYSSGRYLADM